MRSDKLKSLKIISENYQYLFTLRPSTQIFIKRVNKKLLRDEKLTKYELERLQKFKDKYKNRSKCVFEKINKILPKQGDVRTLKEVAMFLRISVRQVNNYKHMPSFPNKSDGFYNLILIGDWHLNYISNETSLDGDIRENYRQIYKWSYQYHFPVEVSQIQKRCDSCHEWKDLTDFYTGSNINYHRKICKSCFCAYSGLHRIGGLTYKNISQDLLAFKKQQIELSRLLRQIKKKTRR